MKLIVMFVLKMPSVHLWQSGRPFLSNRDWVLSAQISPLEWWRLSKSAVQYDRTTAGVSFIFYKSRASSSSLWLLSWVGLLLNDFVSFFLLAPPNLLQPHSHRTDTASKRSTNGTFDRAWDGGSTVFKRVCNNSVKSVRHHRHLHLGSEIQGWTHSPAKPFPIQRHEQLSWLR